MIIKTSNVKLTNKIPFKLAKTQQLQEQILSNWNTFITNQTDCFNGDIYVVTNIKNKESNYEIELSEAKFADLVYAKDKSNNFTLYPFFSGILPKTKDNYYVLVRNNKNKVNCIGGMASKEDFIDNVFNPMKCLERELKEELNLSLENRNHVLEYNQLYLKIPTTEKNMYSSGIIYTGKLNYTKEELKEFFIKNKHLTDNEIKELLFYTKDNYKDIDNEIIKADYIVELITKIENDND